jgi:hypothetical protein
MTKLAGVLNINESIRTKSFELAGHTFKVRVPLTKELEEMMVRIADVSEEALNARIGKMRDVLSTEKVDGVEVTNDDIIIDGRSTKETATAVLQMEQRILEYIKLLVPENGSMQDITYADVEEAFPLQVQFELLEKISEVIQPGYKDAKKN